MKRKMSLLCFFLFAYYFETRSHVICGGLKLTIQGRTGLEVPDPHECWDYMSASLGFLKAEFENYKNYYKN